MISIGIDPAREFGVAIYDQKIGIIKSYAFKFISLNDLEKLIKYEIDLRKPDIIILAQAAGKFTKCIWQHGKYSGVIENLCQKKDVQYLELFDNVMRKAVHGTGKMTKQEVMTATGVDNDNIADAITASKYIDYLDKN